MVFITSEAGQFSHVNSRDAGGDQVTQGVGGVIAAQALFVGVCFEDVGGVVGIVLEKGEAIEEALAAFVNEESGFDIGAGIAEASEDFGPALDAIGVGGAEGDAQRGELGG